MKARRITIGTLPLRPCKTIVDLWSSVSRDYPGIQLQIVPLMTLYPEWLNVLENLGKDLDIVAGIYPSTIRCRCQILPLTEIPPAVRFPGKIRCPPGKTPSAGSLRRKSSDGRARRHEIYRCTGGMRSKNHPQIHIQDVASYGTGDSISATGPTVSWSRSEPGQSFTHR